MGTGKGTAKIEDAQYFLTTWAQQQCGKPYVWGDTDCASLAVKATEIVYPKALNLPHWSCKLGAYRVLKEGGGSIERWLRSLGFVEKPWQQLKSGDIACLKAAADSCSVYLSNWNCLSAELDNPPRIYMLSDRFDEFTYWSLS